MNLKDILQSAEALLLDFDGPVCGVFAGYPARDIANEMRRSLANRGVNSPEIGSPHELYTWAAMEHPAVAQWLDDFLTDREVSAVKVADPTEGADYALRQARAAGLPVAVVSNNAERAVRDYLGRHGLDSYISLVLGRPPAAPELMKPNPHLIRRAVDLLGVSPATAPLVGDSITDMQAAAHAHVPGVGYAKIPRRREPLAVAGSAVVVDSMTEIAEAIGLRL
jgi:phosphoglycolate phosphatase-like HAD superfamily hydrolase